MNRRLQEIAIDLEFPIADGHGHVSGRDWREARDLNGHVEVFEALGVLHVESRNVEERGQPARAGGEVVVGGDVEGCGDAEGGVAVEVDDEGLDGRRLGEREEVLVERWVVEADDFEGGGDVVGGRRGEVVGVGEGDGGEVVEGHGRMGRGDSVDEVGVRRWGGEEEDGDGEGRVVVEDVLPELHHGGEVASSK